MTSPSTPFCDSETLLSTFSNTDLIRWRSMGHPDYDWCLRTKMTDELWMVKTLNVRRHNLLISIRNHGRKMNEMTYDLDGFMCYLKNVNRSALRDYKRKIDRHNYNFVTRRPDGAITRSLFDKLEQVYLHRMTWKVHNFDLTADWVSQLADETRRFEKVRALRSRKYAWKWIDFSDIDDPEILGIIDDILEWAGDDYNFKFADCANHDVVYVSQNSRTKLTKFFE